MYSTKLVSFVSRFLMFEFILSMPIFRCDADDADLDGPGGSRSHKHTLALMEVLGKKELWDQYGIVSDIMVCNTYYRII